MGAKQAVMKKHTVTHIQVKSDEKKKSNLELLIFVDNKWLSCLLLKLENMTFGRLSVNNIKSLFLQTYF